MSWDSFISKGRGRKTKTNQLMQRQSLTNFHVYTEARLLFKQQPSSQNPPPLCYYYRTWCYLVWNISLVNLGPTSCTSPDYSLRVQSGKKKNPWCCVSTVFSSGCNIGVLSTVLVANPKHSTIWLLWRKLTPYQPDPLQNRIRQLNMRLNLTWGNHKSCLWCRSWCFKRSGLQMVCRIFMEGVGQSHWGPSFWYNQSF